MTSFIRTNSDHPDFAELVKSLDIYLAEIDGDEHEFYARFNKTDKIKYVIVAYNDDEPAGCGAMKEYAPGIMEIKRMYTVPSCRGKGIATMVLTELEIWAIELFFEKCILETGKRQEDAICLYKRKGYNIIPNFGQYAGIENSVCFEKEIRNK